MWTRREILVVAAIVSLTFASSVVVYVASSSPATGLVPFHSYGELSDFLNGARNSLRYAPAATGLFSGTPSPTAGPMPGPPAAPTTGGTPSYSGTNVQVAGVDELDMVKTDGTYLYLASQGDVDIFLAYPAASMHIVSRIALSNLTTELLGENTTAWASGLFLDGSTLIVVAQTSTYAYGSTGGSPPMMAATSAVLEPAPARTVAFLFDVSDPAAPALLHTLTVTGWPSTGRMVDGTVYIVATQWIQAWNGGYPLPQTCANGTCANLSADQVYHDPQSEDSWDFTNVLAVDVATGASRVISIVTGGYTVLYMSPTSMYLAFYKWLSSPVAIAMPFVPVSSGGGWTTIYRLDAAGLQVSPGASGNVPGSLLSQYSMDEWQGHLRVATTQRSFSSTGSTATNGVYVFDDGMHLVGSVQNLAPGESIFAVRFVEDKAYVVTFRRIDPLFVVDLSDPASPSVSGFLEMPGFSDYLYPLDAGHLVGLGKDAVPAVDGNWSWYQGLKLALYNVTDPTAPSETANVTIGDRGSDSEALYDPHAFLYIPAREVVVIPVDLAVVNASDYPYGVPDYAWGNVVWQGVYLFSVNETTGFHEIGRVAQGSGTVNESCGWYGSPTEIRRTLYIGDVLYTISGTAVQANSLEDLSLIASVPYATAPQGYGGCPVIVTPGLAV